MKIGRILCAMVPALLLSSSAYSVTYDETLIGIEAQLTQLSSEYARHNPSMKSKSLDERLAEGLTMQAAGDYQRASYIYMDILAQEDWRGKAGYQTAQLELARSLYENGYYLLSQQYLIDLLRTGRGNERTEGVMLLLQVAQKTGNWSEVNMALADVSDFSQHPSYLYIMGRASFLQGDYELARKCLAALRSSDEWQVKAQYLLGVLNTIAGDYTSALSHFKSVETTTVEFRSKAQVIELAILAQARLYYEQGQWKEATQEYQRISDKSAYFPTVLYEMAWTLLRAEDYVMAQQSFELLLLSYPEDSHALETRRLLADIKRQLGQYDEAVATYQTLVNEFDPIMAKMDEEAKNLDSHRERVKSYIESEQYNNVNIVPAQARGVVAVGSDVNQVESMLSALHATDSNTNDSEILIAEISAALQDDDTLRNLPEFQRYSNSARDIRISVLLTGYKFTEAYSGDLPNLSEEIKTLEHLPRSSVEREIIASLQNAARESRQSNQHHIRLKIDNITHKIQVLRSWISSGKVANMTESEKAEITSRIEALEAKLKTMNDDLAKLNGEIAQIRGNSSISREQHSAYLTSAQALEEALQARWSSDMQKGVNNTYSNLIETSRRILTQLDAFDQTFEAALQKRATELREKLQREITFVEAEKSRFVSMKSEVGETAGDISVRYWEDVYAQVREIVLNADLGMVDIAWLLKDARSKALAATLDERKKEREVLEQDFKQFLKESGDTQSP